MPYKYRPYTGIALEDRKWPNAQLTHAPVFCSTDLRDGNQALAEPMNTQEKLEFFDTLVKIGFKEIEVGFPSSSEADYQTVRRIIEEDRAPRDVWLQVLTPAREELIDRTFESLEGAKKFIVHLYMNISPFFREVVYGVSREELIKRLAHAARYIRSRTEGCSGVRFALGLESFTDAEPEFAVEVCTELLDAFGATAAEPLIFNLPVTVERFMPNQFADRIEYMIGHLPQRERYIMGVHTHNDRGTGVAAAELALLAGAQRVEGTLFGNGERTGNMDMVTLAMNLYTQGIDPGLDFSRINDIRRVYERTTRMRVPPRQPYAGDLVFTSFSGTHQDAIRKGFLAMEKRKSEYWDMPYLPVDPKDVGRAYEPIIRINSQSGKGGAAFILSEYYGYNLPKAMHADFGHIVQMEADRAGTELPNERLLTLFLTSYCDINTPYRLLRHSILEHGAHDGRSSVLFDGEIEHHGERSYLRGEGNGPIDAFFSALREAHIGEGIAFASYHEHAIGSGSDAKACAYIELTCRGESFFGVGVDENVSIASIKGVLSALNRAIGDKN